jgi:hypothetical protein
MERSSIEQGTGLFSEYLSDTSDISSEILVFLAALYLKIISLQYSLERKGFDSLLLICIVLYTMFRFSLKSIGKMLRFSVQGVEKINDDIKSNSSFKNKQMAVMERSTIEQGTGLFSEYLSDTSDISSEILAFLAALCLKIISLQYSFVLLV